MADALRLICACWVMWLHIPESEQLGRTTAYFQFRMPFFVVLAVYFQLYYLHKRPMGFVAYVRSRFQRIYLPFLVWSALYFALDCAIKGITHRPLPQASFWWLIYGPTIHLWFLPMIFSIGLAVYPVARWIHRQPGDDMRTFAWIAAGFGVAASVAGQAFNLGTLCAAAPFGVAAYCFYRSAFDVRGVSPVVQRTALVILTLMAAADLVLHATLIRNLAGFALLLVALRPTHWRIWQVLGQFGRCSYGMYLVHMIFVACMFNLHDRVLCLPPSWWWDLTTLAVCVAGSLMATHLMSRWKLTRWLVPGAASSPTPARAHVAVIASSRQVVSSS